MENNSKNNKREKKINLTSSSLKAVREPQKWRLDHRALGRIHVEQGQQLFSSPAEASLEPAGTPEAASRLDLRIWASGTPHLPNAAP